MMHVSLTGSSGFVGKNLISSLNNTNFDLHLINRAQLANVDSSAFDNTDVIIHLAGKAHDLKKSSNPREYYEVNFEITKKLYTSFLKSEAKKFIFISSVKSCADSVDGVLNENDIPNPQTDYGKSKLLAEEYIIKQELPIGKSYYILRPCMIHGPGNKGNLNLLYKFVQMRIPYPLAAFENKRSFLSVENLCFVIKNLLIKDSVPSGIYQVADDEPLSTNEVVGLLAKASGRKLCLWKLPVRFIHILAMIGDKLKLPLNTESLKKLTESYVVSNIKIKKALQEELPLKSRDGLLKTASSFRID